MERIGEQISEESLIWLLSFGVDLLDDRVDHRIAVRSTLFPRTTRDLPGQALPTRLGVTNHSYPSIIHEPQRHGRKS